MSQDQTTTDQTQAKEFRLSDPTIAGFMQILNAALMTGTDILDLMRMLQFEEKAEEEGYLFITDKSARGVEEFCNSLLERAEEAAKASMKADDDKLPSFEDIVKQSSTATAAKE